MTMFTESEHNRSHNLHDERLDEQLVFEVKEMA